MYRITSRTGPARAGFSLLLTLTGSLAFGQTDTAAPAPANNDEVITLSAFTVNTERDVGYRATNSIAATRSNTPIRDIPMNIQVFTKDLVDDLQVTNQVELEAYNASLVNGGADSRSSNPIQQAYNAFLFRGFVQNWGIRDGIREYDPIDTQGLARVEVIKGPAAPLYGLAYPGGIMNNITKDVDFHKNFTSVRLTGTDQGETRATIDANYTGAVAGGKFGVRFNAANTESKDDRSHSDGAVRYTQVLLNWQPAPATEVKFIAERGYREKPNGLSYFTTGETDSNGNALGNQASIPLQIYHPEIPWTWNWSNGANMRSLDTKLYRGTVNQAIGDNFQVTGYVQFSERKQIDGDGWDANGSGGADSWEAGGGWIINRDPVTHQIVSESIQAGYSYRDWSNTMHSYGATGVYKFEVAKVKNTFTFGSNVWSEKFVSRSSTQAGSASQQLLAYPVAANIPITIPFGPPTDLHAVTDGNGYTHENNSNDYYFASWQMAAFDNRLKLNASINHTNLKLVQWANGQATVPNTTEQSKDSPMFGGMFDITKEISVFAVHSSSLFPETTKDSFGHQMPPQVGTGNEAGLKVEVLNGKISGTVSYYEISQTGGFQVDSKAENLNTQRWDGMSDAERAVAFPGKTRSDLLGDNVPGGKQESKGFEADLFIQPTRQWQVMLSYAHNNQEVVSAINTATIGQSTSGHVKDQFSVLTKYAFTDGSVKGLFIGAGLHAAGKALQDYNGPGGSARYNPSTLDLEAFSGYKFKLLGYDASVQLNVKNITRQAEYFGWKATGSASVIATERYEIPTAVRYSLTFGLDF